MHSNRHCPSAAASAPSLATMTRKGSSKRPLSSCAGSSHSSSSSCLSSASSSGGSASFAGNASTLQAIQRLEHLTLEVEASNQRSDVRYVLRVRHRGSRARWSQSRSFDEYKAFQKRLVGLMRQGHFCHAECPWLYSFLTSYFPKSTMFRSSSSCVITRRQEALHKIVQQLHQFLLTRGNHSCSVTHNVALAFYDFVCAGVDIGVFDGDHRNGSFADKSQRASSGSLASSTTDEESLDEPHCPLCEKSFADPTIDGGCYTTVLGCGHEFHDECILTKLNEDMHCPVCGHSELS